MAAPSLMVPETSQQQQQRRRQVSVPQEFWQQRSPNSTSFNSMQFGRSPMGRPRASTVTDRLAVGARPSATTATTTTTNGGLSATPVPRPTTPESTNSSTGVAEDYFAYLSAYQPLPTTTTKPPQLTIPTVQPPQLSVSSHPQSSGPSNQVPEMTIPEIRLAPPTVEQQQQYHTPLTTVDPHRLPSPDQRTGGSSLHVMTPSPSVNSTTTDYDCFVSARQSPELTPTLFDHDPAPPPMLLEDDDDEEEVEQKHMPSTQEERNNNTTEKTRRWYAYLLDIYQVLFPTLQEWGSKSYLSRISSLVAMPLVLIFTLTLPVAEAEDVKVDEVEVMMIRDDDDDYVYHTSAGLYPPQQPQQSHHQYRQQQPMEAGQRYYYSSNTSPISSTTAPPYHHHQSYGSFFTAANDGLLPPTTIKPSSSSFLAVPASESDCLLQPQQKQQQQQQHSLKATPSLHSELLDVIDADLQQGWCRWLVAVQAVLSTTFLFCVLVCKS